MKRLIVGIGILLMCGCSMDGQVRNMIRDPEFTEYQKTLDEIERDYLHKKITYDQYLKRKQQVEENYERNTDLNLGEDQNSAPAADELTP